MAGTDPKPLFIAGHPRSGTTLLLSLLDGHPDLCVFPADNMGFFTSDDRTRVETDSGRVTERFFGKLVRAATLEGTGETDVGTLEDAYHSAVEARWSAAGHRVSAYLGAAVMAFGDITDQAGRRWWVEKSPLTENYGATLSRWYPEFKMLYMVRDPRGVYSSMRLLSDRPGYDVSVPRFASRMAWSLAQNERNHKVFPVLDVRYEDLVERTLETMQEVCTFLDIEFDTILLRPTVIGSDRKRVSSYGDSSTKVEHDSLRKWAGTLPPSEIALLQQLLGGTMRRYGYEPVAVDGAAGRASGRYVLNSLLKHTYDLYYLSPEGLRNFYKNSLRDRVLALRGRL